MDLTDIGQISDICYFFVNLHSYIKKYRPDMPICHLLLLNIYAIIVTNNVK